MKSAALLFPVAIIALTACSQPEETPTAPVEASVPDERADLISEGRAIVEANCTACHAIGAEGDSPRQDAPTLRTVFAEFDAEAIGDDFREGIHVGALDMPDFDFGPLGTEALIAYIRSIQTEVPAE